MSLVDLKILLILGFVPYHIQNQHHGSGLRHIEIRALFWTCIIKQGLNGRHNWKLRISLIEKLHQSVWAAVMHWKDNKLSDREDVKDGSNQER